MVSRANDAYFPMSSTPAYPSVVAQLEATHVAIFSEQFDSVSNKELISFTEDQLRIVEELRNVVPAEDHARLDQMIAVLKKLILNMADLVDLA